MTQEIVGKLQGELGSSDRAGQPAKEGETRPEKSRSNGATCGRKIAQSARRWLSQKS